MVARAGLTRVMLPARNRKDLEDIPQDARDLLEFVWLERAEDAITAHIGALPGFVGVSLTAGTGIACIGSITGRRAVRIDGHGVLLGDDGGGFWIGREGHVGSILLGS